LISFHKTGKPWNPEKQEAMMDRARIRGPPDGRFDEAAASPNRPFFVVIHLDKKGEPL
jgi:hypothetical protein